MVEASDSATLSERAVVAATPNDSRVTTAFRVSDSAVPYSSAADLEDDERVRIRIEGRPQQHEDGAALAAGHVIDRLNEAGAEWRGAEVTESDARTERGVDVIARGPGRSILQVQVTRALEETLWGALAVNGVVDVSLSVDEIVDALWAAICRKSLSADAKVVLVIDAANLGQFALRPVIDGFRKRRGRDATAVGYQAIWVSGPTTDSTFQTDASL
jgi:hypothetical protein